MTDKPTYAHHVRWQRAYDAGHEDGKAAGVAAERQRTEAAEAVALQAEDCMRDEVPRLIAEAVAEERQRIRQLAIDHEATCYVACPDLTTCKRGYPHEAPFADLLDGGGQDTP